MENTTGLIQDAIKTALNIYNSLTPYDEFVIVNLCKTSNSTFTYPSYPEIPTGFGYTYDKVPEIFEKDGVIEAKTSNKWFIGLTKTPYSQTNLGSLPSYDLITLIARTKGYLDKVTRTNYYCKWGTSRVDEGPLAPGQFSVLVNVKNLIKFIRWYGNQTPKFDFKKGELSYLGFSKIFSGEDKIKALKLLVDNINSMVSLKEFYEIRDGVNYENDIKKSAEKIQKSMESMYKTIKKEISNSDFKDRLILAQQNGFGMFIATPRKK